MLAGRSPFRDIGWFGWPVVPPGRVPGGKLGTDWSGPGVCGWALDLAVTGGTAWGVGAWPGPRASVCWNAEAVLLLRDSRGRSFSLVASIAAWWAELYSEAEEVEGVL